MALSAGHAWVKTCAAAVLVLAAAERALTRKLWQRGVRRSRKAVVIPASPKSEPVKSDTDGNMGPERLRHPSLAELSGGLRLLRRKTWCFFGQKIILVRGYGKTRFMSVLFCTPRHQTPPGADAILPPRQEFATGVMKKQALALQSGASWAAYAVAAS